MKITTIIFFALLNTLLIACGGNVSEPLPPQTETPRVAKDEASCRALDGEWKRQGRIGAYACVFTGRDAGQQCTDTSQCEYKCLVKPATEMPAVGSRVTGQCQTTSSPFGCKYEVLDGIVQPGLCID